MRLLVLLVGMAFCAHAAVELQIEHSVIKKILSERVFTDDGRKYVRANRTSKCTYAYLENPEIGADRGRLKIRAHFSGRSARDFFGRCIGLGDAFNLTITAAPYYQDGAIALKDVKVRSEDRDGFYVRRVCYTLTQSLSTDFKYRVIDDAKALLEERRDKTPFQQQLLDFKVSQIRVDPEAVILILDLTLRVK